MSIYYCIFVFTHYSLLLSFHIAIEKHDNMTYPLYTSIITFQFPRPYICCWKLETSYSRHFLPRGRVIQETMYIISVAQLCWWYRSHAVINSEEHCNQDLHSSSTSYTFKGLASISIWLCELWLVQCTTYGAVNWHTVYCTTTYVRTYVPTVASTRCSAFLCIYTNNVSPQLLRTVCTIYPPFPNDASGRYGYKHATRVPLIGLKTSKTLQ